MSDKHQKHPPMKRVGFGEFSRAEVSILGTKCGAIRQMAIEIANHVNIKTAYIDAEHGDGETASPFYVDYTDKVNFHRFDSSSSFEKFDKRRIFNDIDLTLVNGNHYHAEHQIVVLDPAKYDSVKRKVDRLTSIFAFVQIDEDTDVFDFLLEHDAPVFQSTQIDKLSEYISQNLLKPAPLKGLILAGGKSTRMGKDKGSIEIHGKTQREFMIDLVKPYTSQQYLSCRAGQETEIGGGFNFVPDRLTDMGPFGAIVSAYMSDPEAAWLVLAIDLPHFDDDSVAHLIKHRNPSACATALKSPQSGFPEPLAAIWEPKCYQHLLSFMAQGYSCPRKVLINSPHTEIIEPLSAQSLLNMNTPEDLLKVRQHL